MAAIRRSTRQRKPVKREEYHYGTPDEEEEENLDLSTASPAVPDRPNVDVGADEAANSAYDDDDDDDDDGAHDTHNGDDDVVMTDVPSAARQPQSPTTPRRKTGIFRPSAPPRRRKAPSGSSATPHPDASSAAHPQQLIPHAAHPPESTYYLPLDIFPTDERHTRQYRGPLPRNSTGYSLVRHIGGPDRYDISRLAATVARWYEYDVLPNKVPGSRKDPMGSLWVPEGFERLMAGSFASWFERWRAERSGMGGGAAGQVVRVLGDVRERERYEFGSDKELAVQLGLLNAPQTLRVKRGQSFPVDVAGLRLPAVPPSSAASSEPPPAGWLFDTGGIVIAMDWMPKATHGDQVLALSVIPHADQDIGRDASLTNPAEQPGSVQLWVFPRNQHPANKAQVPARLSPKRVRTICADRGRVRRLGWCPVPMPETVEGGGLGLLAILTGDGAVRVIHVTHSPSQNGIFEKVERPMVTLSLAPEASVAATSFTWIMTNRICVGHEDGSITLWSLNPLHLLSRHAVQHTHVMTIKSAFPSSPYIVAVSAVSGLAKLVDLSNPSTETTAAGTHAVVTEPGLVAWSDHTQAFLAKVPSSNPQNHGIVMLPIRHFGGMGKRVIKPDAAPVCLDVGALHPFLLTGLVDGSLWANNPTRLVFAPKSNRVALKLRLFQHEFRPVARWATRAPEDEASCRGAARILTGWTAKPNRTPHVVRGKNDELGDGDEDDQDVGAAARAKPRGKKRAASGVPAAEEEREPVGAVFEPLSRVTAVAWNPNEGFACWAAAAMGSGLVKVMDLGLVE